MVSSLNKCCLTISRFICLALLWSMYMSCVQNFGNLMWETNPSVADWASLIIITIIIAACFYGIYEVTTNFPPHKKRKKNKWRKNKNYWIDFKSLNWNPTITFNISIRFSAKPEFHVAINDFHCNCNSRMVDCIRFRRILCRSDRNKIYHYFFGCVSQVSSWLNC